MSGAAGRRCNALQRSPTSAVKRAATAAHSPYSIRALIDKTRKTARERLAMRVPKRRKPHAQEMTVEAQAIWELGLAPGNNALRARESRPTSNHDLKKTCWYTTIFPLRGPAP